ncbi:electron transport complex subunit RsxA [Dehalococcoidia bacterium]|nr:electron transport complex subunit RsxA [Dehalococcoidia bacterium]MCL0050354.1 electron transport complex subunit RsxA [Dehalococcoidia bacterium]MCL0070757.1 electron transport complex subunit RsxA [Dehalococcoidia bacterium]MCL0075672.1 electron transport complex subunit RsxA [Dehalococcoidia bacterium]MCL0088646.1 electron transport complex subunit RsxA [Dehalococcoidia bacterium]
MNELIVIFVSMAFVNNVVFARYLGLCPYFGVSKKTGPALGMGMAVIFVMLIAAAATWLINHYILIPFNVQFMQIVIFILVISSLVQITELFIKRTSATLYNALGIFLALITTNCAVLFVTLWNALHDYTFIESIVSALASGIGFAFALILMSGIRERLEIADCPRSMRGLPIAFIAAMMLSLALIGLGGMI